MKEQIHTATVPFGIPPFHCQIAWHARHERDAGHRWMRTLVMRTCDAIWADGIAPEESA